MTRYLITGGTGSLGKALIQRLLQNPENEIIVFSRDEGKQALAFGKYSEIIRVIGDIRDFDKVIGDIRDLDKLSTSMLLHSPDYVIHTAALKRIDDMEFHPDECVKTNIAGSENVARASLLNRVQKCVLISTDKACQPVNVYGSSKFIAERCFTNYDYYSPDTMFIPQICSYDMNTIISAVEKMHGSPVEYELIGLRPGEKLHEDMLAVTELPFTYKVPGLNLLSVRPQYTKRTLRSDWEDYTGPEFNSALHMSDNIEELVQLIHRGLEDAN